MFKLGQTLRDRVTGYQGIAIARIEYLNGCVQFCIKPPVKDGKMAAGEYVDHQQLELVDDGLFATGEAELHAAGTGGPSPDAPRSDRYIGG